MMFSKPGELFRHFPKTINKALTYLATVREKKSRWA